MVSILATVRDAIRKRQQKPFVSVTQDIIDLKSPLIECCEGDLVPGVVPIKDRQLCNDATILSESPLSVIMPRQQWSYGLLLPINHAKLVSDSKGIVIQLKLRVRNGNIGIAGIDASLKTMTTLEHCVGSGEATVTLTIDDVQRTKALVLRTASAQNTNPELTLLTISAHRPPEARLAPHRHDLGFDLFVILSPGKTATQTIEQTLLSLGSSAQVRRMHFLSTRNVEGMRATVGVGLAPQSSSIMDQVVQAENVRREIEMVRGLGGTVAFVTGVREPIDRAIASMFHNIPSTLPFYAQLHAAGPWLVKLLSETAILSWREDLRKTNHSMDREFGTIAGWVNLADYFFRDEILPITGTDILRYPVDRDAGYTLLKNGRTSTLFFRYEDIERGLAAGLSALTGRTDIKLKDANVSADKGYADLYREFRAGFRVPPDLCSAIYEKSPFIRHFYSDAEIAQFKARWSDSESLNRIS